jgi:hypothetical protein
MQSTTAVFGPTTRLCSPTTKKSALPPTASSPQVAEEPITTAAVSARPYLGKLICTSFLPARRRTLPKNPWDLHRALRCLEAWGAYTILHSKARNGIRAVVNSPHMARFRKMTIRRVQSIWACLPRAWFVNRRLRARNGSACGTAKWRQLWSPFGPHRACV